MKTKKHDFVEIDFIGRIKETNHIFDLTKEDVAKENKIYDPKITYKPLIICIGEGEVVKGLDDFLENKEIDKEYKIELNPEKAFGKKDPKLMRILPLSVFKKSKITPFPGLQINMDGFMGIVRVVSGGRVIMDFNHPLAGKNIIYELKINKIIEDDKEKVKSILNLIFKKEIDFELKENNLKIKIALPKQLEDKIKEKIKKLIPIIKRIEFISTKKQPLKNK